MTSVEERVDEVDEELAKMEGWDCLNRPDLRDIFRRHLTAAVADAKREERERRDRIEYAKKLKEEVATWPSRKRYVCYSQTEQEVTP